MNQELIIRSCDGINYVSIRDVKEFYIVRSSILEISSYNSPIDVSYHLMAELVDDEDNDKVDVVIKFNCTYDYIVDFLFSLEDYAFN